MVGVSGEDVRLVPADVLTGAAPLCAEFDTARAQAQRVIRDGRVAADSAVRGSRGRRAYWRGVADSLARLAPDASARRERAQEAIRTLLEAQPAFRTDVGAHYSIGGIRPGKYALYANTLLGLGYVWVAPVEVHATAGTLNLDSRNAWEVLSNLQSTIAQAACRYDPDRPGADEDDAEKYGIISVVPPELLNRDEAAKAVSRRYPPALRGISGSALLSFRVLADGTVDPYSIVIREATHAEFGDAAAVAVESMRFRPVEVEGHQVAAWVTLPINFSHRN